MQSRHANVFGYFLPCEDEKNVSIDACKNSQGLGHDDTHIESRVLGDAHLEIELEDGRVLG
jgi:hypothetical protein